jgi:DNA-binding transcriptional LysR family regulator
MKTSLKQLKIFVETARHKQISLAAHQCHITQSAASMALAELESRLNMPLFDRVGKRLVLNEVGRSLLPKALEILERVNEFEDLSHTSELQGQLKIGASKTIGAYILPPMIAHFLEKYPKVKVDYQIKNSNAVAEAVLNSELDMGFIEAPIQHPELKSTLFRKDRLVIFAKVTHPLAKKSKLTVQDLEKYSWILREPGSGTREIFLHAIKNILPSINILMELNDAEAIKNFVKNTDSLSCLAESVIQKEMKNKTLVELKIPEIKMNRSLTLITRTNKYATQALSAFRNFVTT